MATQHELARRLFPLVTDAARHGTWLTYKDAALRLGFTANHARALAQVCDLLDASAAWSGVPLLALSYVRSTDGKYNPKAFDRAEQKKYRQAIFDRSRTHKFTQANFDAILDALEGEFAEDSNVSSWSKIIKKFSSKEYLWARLASGNPIEADALNDLGSDTPDTRILIAETYIRDERVRQAVLLRAKGSCEYCGELGFQHVDGSIYLECHHIVHLAKDGEDRITNVIALCPGHHREAHFGASRDGLEKKMIAIVRAKTKTTQRR